MGLDAIIPVIKSVLSDKRVIMVAVLVFLYLDFVIYVSRYHKRPPRPRVRKTMVPPAPTNEEVSEENGTNNEFGGIDE